MRSPMSSLAQPRFASRMTIMLSQVTRTKTDGNVGPGGTSASTGYLAMIEHTDRCSAVPDPSSSSTTNVRHARRSHDACNGNGSRRRRCSAGSDGDDRRWAAACRGDGPDRGAVIPRSTRARPRNPPEKPPPDVQYRSKHGFAGCPHSRQSGPAYPGSPLETGHAAVAGLRTGVKRQPTILMAPTPLPAGSKVADRCGITAEFARTNRPPRPDCGNKLGISSGNARAELHETCAVHAELSTTKCRTPNASVRADIGNRA